MTPESESCSNQVLQSRTEAGGSSALKLELEAKHEKHGLDPSADSEPLSEAKHNNDRPMDSPTSSLSCPGSVKKPNSGEDGPLDNSPDVLEQSEQWSMVSVSPRSGGGNSSTEFSPLNAEGNMFDSSPMKPPSVQTMSSPSGYDPNRIPSSIFSRPSTPTEWSVASNESLFSIQMGNNSFSRDYAFMLETKPEDWCNSPLHVSNVSETKSNEYNSNLPPVSEAASENDKKSLEDITEDYLAGKDFPLPRTENLPEISVERDKENVVAGGHTGRLSVTASNLSEGRRLSSVEGARPSLNPPRGSSESADSCGSFAFPLLVENGKSGRSCSQRTMSATQGNKDKEEGEPPLPETQNQELEPAAKCSWFSCRMCWPGCCFKMCL